MVAFFRASMFTVVGDGRSAMFWEDRWIQGLGVPDIAPYLSWLVPRRIKASQTVQGLQHRSWVRAISGGLTTLNVAGYPDLWAATENFILNDQPDQTVWWWTPDGEYTAKSSYNKLHVGGIPFCGHSLIWKSWAPLRVKIFLWLAFRKRHWTNEWRALHSLDVQSECFLCDQAPESIDHILTSCPFTREV